MARNAAKQTEDKQKPTQHALSGLDETTQNNEADDSDYPISPEFWERMLDSLPPWGDEIAAIMLIVFGVVSFLSLMEVSTEATLATAWANALTGLFGYGSIIVAGGILGLGVIILLPKLGIIIKFPTQRIIALELMFLSVLAIMHLAVGDAELRAIARAGQGGGLIGWALSQIVAGLFGRTVALVFFSTLSLISLGVVAGINRQHVSKRLQKSQARLEKYGERWLEDYRKTRKVSQPTSINGVSVPSIRPMYSERNPLMRIRLDPSNIPPSLRAARTQPVHKLQRASKDKPAEDTTPIEEHPLFNRSDMKVEFNAIGTIQKRRNRNEPMMVKRPDGRLKRYFTVEGMKEPRKVAKRDKALPSLDLLQDIEISLPDEQEINQNVVLIENTLLEFDINVDVVDVKIGPTVTQYAVQPFRETRGDDGAIKTERTRLSKIASYSQDLALALSARRLRMEIPVPGHSYMGIEVPNKNPSVVALRSVYESRQYYEMRQKSKSPLFVPLGRDVAGEPIGIDLAGMPHLLIAGTTGSGKSVAIAAIASALILDNTPDRVQMVMLDPKMVELSRFNGLPHLIGPVETDIERIIGVLRWCTREMDRRYKLLEEHAARNIEIFNERMGQRRRGGEYLPYIVIMIDEIGDLMMQKPEETEKTVTRLAQMARAVGMHLIVATQRPSVDVITGLIKANFPSRISFAVASGVDSRVILDTVGAETLLGKGDMLYLAPDASGPKRLQGCFISDDEVRALVDHWKRWKGKQIAAGKLKEERIAPWERGLTRREFLAETDPMLEEAIELVVEEREASASLIQRKLGLGYPRAARLMDLLEQLGVIGDAVAGGRSRKVLIEPGQDPFKHIIDKKLKN